VVRTDFTDDAVWDQVVESLEQPWGDNFSSTTFPVTDPAWAGADPDEVLAALPDGRLLDVVFIADATTMRGRQALLAVSTTIPAPSEDYESEYNEREFRILPQAVAEMQANLATGNMSFHDFADSALGDQDRIHRSFL
jgi:hypothetical protein